MTKRGVMTMRGLNSKTFLKNTLNLQDAIENEGMSLFPPSMTSEQQQEEEEEREERATQLSKFDNKRLP